MKPIYKFAVAAVAFLILGNLIILDSTRLSGDNFGSSFGTQNFFYAPGNVITPLAGFTTSWTGSSFSTTSASYYLANTSPLLLSSIATMGSGSPLWTYGASSTDANAFDIWNPSLTPLYPYFSLRSSGYLGLSTSSPVSLLTVAGNASIGADSNKAAPTNGLTVQGGILSQASSTIGAGSLASGLTINGAATTSATTALSGTSGTIFYVGDSVVANSNALTYTYKVGSSNGALASIGLNTYLSLAGATTIINSNTSGWSIQSDCRNSNTTCPLTINSVTAGGSATNVYKIFSTGLLQMIGTLPTVATSTGSGTGSVPVTIVGNANDYNFTITTGTTPSGSNATIATLTLPSSCANLPIPIMLPASSAAAALAAGTQPYAVQSAANQVTLKANTSGLTGATTYVWNIHVGCY